MKTKFSFLLLLLCTTLAHAGPGGEKGGASGGNGGGGFWLCDIGMGYAPVDEAYPEGTIERLRYNSAGDAERKLMGCVEFGLSSDYDDQ